MGSHEGTHDDGLSHKNVSPHTAVAETSPLHLNYCYGNFYNCPIKKGISVKSGASASLLTRWRSSAGRASDL